jgi:acyl carrier protein
MVAIESAFEVRIRASEAAKLNNVGELADLIERKLG